MDTGPLAQVGKNPNYRVTLILGNTPLSFYVDIT